jgi:hypothetical protein
MGTKKHIKKAVGRKPKMIESTLGKLREAFLLGCSDTEACLYADIHPDTLYEYQKKNPIYSEQKKLLKNNPVLLARKTVVESLKGDPNLALKYLERKLSDEFSLKQKVDAKIEEPTKITGFSYIVPKGSQVPCDLFDRHGKPVTVTVAEE